MGIHQTLKHCKNCAHAVPLDVDVCPKCKSVFDKIESELPTFNQPISASMTPAEIIAGMQEKKAAQESGAAVEHQHVELNGMSPSQMKSINQEKSDFSKRWKEMTAKKDKF